MLSERLGVAPQNIGDKLYIPSKAILKVMVSDESNYEAHDYPNPYKGDKKILVTCTEQDHLETQNDRIFLTGNHPVEMLVPMLHFRRGGFKLEIATPTGKPVKFEDWAMPKNDANFKALIKELGKQLKAPTSLSKLAKTFSSQTYAAVFVPGGHGALLGLPHDKHVKTVLDTTMNEGMTFVSLCHGPASMLACAVDTPADDYVFKGYEIVCNPDCMDRQLARLGYLPGKLKTGFSGQLEELGVKIENKIVIGNTHVDRNVITGDGPPAANKLGVLATETLLENFSS